MPEIGWKSVRQQSAGEFTDCFENTNPEHEHSLLQKIPGNHPLKYPSGFGIRPDYRHVLKWTDTVDA